MNKRTILMLLFCFLALLGCKSKKTTVERTQTSDTLITKSFEYVSQPIETTIRIDEVCDSLGGVKDFFTTETSGNNQAKVYTKDNTLSIDLLTGMSKTKTDTIYKTKFKDVYKDREVIKYRTPFWHYLAHIIFLILLLLYVRRYIF